jgi:hypothetical protein
MAYHERVVAVLSFTFGSRVGAFFAHRIVVVL